MFAKQSLFQFNKDENVAQVFQKSETVFVPLDYLRAAIFAAAPQKCARVIKLKKHNKKYEIGGFDPFLDEQSEGFIPALDIRHGRALFIILTFYRNCSDDPNKHKIRFSLNQFCRRYANSNGGRYTKDIKKLLSDLSKCWFRVTYPDGKEKAYRILSKVVVSTNPRKKMLLQAKEVARQRELWLDEIELDVEFCKLLDNHSELGTVNLKALTATKSLLAQAIYTYIPSRAIDRNENNPFNINLSTLLKEVGYKDPGSKSLRRRIFTQNKKSIIKYLNGVTFSKNGILRARIIETEDKSDYKFLFWNENVKVKNERDLSSLAPKLRGYWLKSGRSEEIFNKKIKQFLQIEPYQKEILSRATIQALGNEPFMRIALSLLGRDRFDELASEVKSMVLELGNLERDPTKIFIKLVCEDLATPV